MSHFIASLAWCWLQILLVAAAAICLSLCVLRKSPSAGATIAWSGIVATLALTTLTFIPLPTGAVGRVFSLLVINQLESTPQANSPPRQRFRTEPDEFEEPGYRATFDGSLIAQFLKSLRDSPSAVVRQHSLARWALGIFAIGVMIGLLRLIGGLVAITALRRQSIAVADSGITGLLTELTPRLPLRHLPQVRETSNLASAAVLGWWRPTIMLPAAWREWSPAELKAVLAHELAHIARSDAPWRLVAAFMVALHWPQPLMHWLRRQLLLAQELAADELAAGLMGSKRDYLQALAKLALRQDGQIAVSPPMALLPVFSGFLLRRIVMLRAKDGSMHRNWRLLTQASALGLVAAVTLFATAIRGLAEPPETESDGSIRVAKATDVTPRPPGAAAAQASEAPLFQRPPFDIAKLALSNQGGFLVRLGEILNQPRFAKAALEQDEWLAKIWKDTFPGAETPPFSLKDIEYFAGDFTLWARHVTPPEGEANPHPHQVVFGSQCGFVRWQKPVDDIFAWLKRTPEAEVKQHGDVSYVQLTLAMLGPAKTCICRLDDHTLLWASSEGFLQKRLDQLAAANDPPAWHSAWKQVEGGLLTAVAAESEYKDPPEVLDETERLTQLFFAKTRLKAIGADWQPNARGNTSFKLQFSFDSEADARAIEAEIRRALERYLQEAREGLKKATKEKDKALGIDLIAMMEQARLDLRQTERGWQIEIQLSGPADIESNL